MKASKTLILVVLFLSSTACSSTRPAGQHFNKVNELGQTKTATVQLVSGISFEANSLRVMADSAFYVHPSTFAPAAIATQNIVDITFKNRRRGAYKGFRNVIFGSVASIAGGFAYGRLRGCDVSDDSQPFIPECTAFYMFAMPILAAPYTIPGGIIIGAAVGDQEKYIVERVGDEPR